MTALWKKKPKMPNPANKSRLTVHELVLLIAGDGDVMAALVQAADLGHGPGGLGVKVCLRSG